MQKSKPLAHAILAFLNFSPMTGYDLKKYFEQSVAHFWSVTQSHIYKTLDSLEKDGYVESSIIQQVGKPNRKEYSISDAGRQKLQRWLITPLPLPPTREAWLIQLFFAYANSNQEIVELLQARKEAIDARIQTYRQDAQAAIDANARSIGNARIHELWQVTLDYGISYYEFERAWLEKTIERIKDLPPMTEQITANHE
jgi:DNA-binding PadR family transcriptional regulator